VNAGFVADADGPGLQGGVPALGADTDAVLGELGYSAEEIARLRERGAV
jgi:crotonobetainyl-CoA:carnitine CoA-transferase CaiB-like acyl-CoA transferase